MPADLFAPFALGDLTLANRLVMAPMTRNRADANGIVPAMMETHYAQRASAGLIISESIPVSPEAIGYPMTPGIYNDAQAESWLRVTDAVHFTHLSKRRLAYLHVLEGDMITKSSALDYRSLRANFAGNYIANNGYDRERAQAALRSGAADLVAFGVPFLANPDLVRRYRDNLPLNAPDPATFYGGGEHGYTDYPFYRTEYLAA
jgi:2,4-dienoyl-CoA reductase-like NADH-dependent reductase (Old Yellow Enzyme family)